MLFKDLDIDCSPALKALCKKIVRNFFKEHKSIDIATEYNIFRDYTCSYINDMNQEEKKAIMYSFSIICYNNNYNSILDKINKNYDGEPLIVICNDVIMNNYLDILFGILDDITIQNY
jgi:hypothetical protein